MLFVCVRRVPRGIGVGQLELQMEFCDHFDVKKKVSGVQKIRKQDPGPLSFFLRNSKGFVVLRN